MYIEQIAHPISKLKGLGPESVKAFANLSIINVAQLVQHYPMRYEDRLNYHKLSDASDQPLSTIVTVTHHDFIGPPANRTLKIYVEDGDRSASLVCFGRPFLGDKLSVGSKIYLHATFTLKYGELQSGSFDFESYSTHPVKFGLLNPVYHLSGSLNQSKVARVIDLAFDYLPQELQSALPSDELNDEERLLNKKTALWMMHHPASYDELRRATSYLKHEEIYCFKQNLRKKRLQQQQPVRAESKVRRALLDHAKQRLGFTLTGDQEQAITDILTDFTKCYPMRRLLQGDVGSGKTLVALLSACHYFEEGLQVAMLAPTELLARQHADHADHLLRPLGISVAFLSSNVALSGRKQLLRHLADGSITLIVGTHCLFSDDVNYNQLSYVIVDEQHRFGVAQRARMMNKGFNPDLLLMSATPIPRSLALSTFADSDFSSIHQQPVGRLAIKSHLSTSSNVEKVYNFVQSQLKSGFQAYFVYPIIEEQEETTLKNVQTMFTELCAVFKDYKVGLIHGRIDEDGKRRAMDGFSSGVIDLLVATSVVEVGIDVANATVMVIEAAERFGLAALHQLRGRVGRGPNQSHCFFVYNEPLTDSAKERLKALYEHDDGFMIADLDLKLRGAGDMTGYKQSGEIVFRLASVDDL